MVPGDPVESRLRPHGSNQWTWRSAQGLDVEAAIYAMAKLCLRQETELSELRQEKFFLLHISAGPHGILKQLIQASLKWNELRDQLKVDCSLKSELFRLMLKETAARMEKFEQTPESIAAAEKAKWVTTQPLTWLYQVWDPVAHILIHDPSSQGIPHQEVKALLETMREALKQDPAALNQFTAKRKLTDNMSGASVAFKVTVGLRSPQCQTQYAAFAKLAGLSILQLIAANMHKERQKHGRSRGSLQPDVALRLRLTNPSGTNSCYVNSTFLLLVHAWAQVGMPAGLLGTLGTSLQALTSTVRPVTLRALHPIQALMRLWAHPDRQHDVVEFFSHFVSFYRMPFPQECWQTRDLRGPDLRVLDEGTLQTPIPLHIPAPSTNGRMRTVQDCVEQFFRGQRCGCALASVAPLLCFQLRRYGFDVRAGSAHKLATPIRLDANPIQVPIWEDVSTLQTRQAQPSQCCGFPRGANAVFWPLATAPACFIRGVITSLMTMRGHESWALNCSRWSSPTRIFFCALSSLHRLTGQLRFNLACNRENEDLMRFILSYHIRGAVSLTGRGLSSLSPLGSEGIASLC